MLYEFHINKLLPKKPHSSSNSSTNNRQPTAGAWGVRLQGTERWEEGRGPWSTEPTLITPQMTETPDSDSP